MANIDWVRIGVKTLTALLSAIVVGIMWYTSVNYSLKSLSKDVILNKVTIEQHISKDEARFYEVQQQIHAANVSSQVDKVLLREISLRLDRVDGKLDRLIEGH